MKNKTSRSIANAIIEVADRHPDRPALTVDGETWSYKELLTAAHKLAAHLPKPSEAEPQPITAIMAQRHCSSYLGILAALLSGHAYVPVNTEHPDKHNRTILKRSGARRVICGALASNCLTGILAEERELGEILQIIHTDDHKPAVASSDTPAGFAEQPAADDIAYILFTSGSTGEPKGVPISHGNLAGYLDAVDDIMDVAPEDRFSQTFELTFDLSVHDYLVCWTHGAHLIVPQPHDLAMPAEYIRTQGITCWFSVPSLAYQIRLQGHLRNNAFPGLRWSLFCGEALPTALAREWAAAAPASRVENWYGPTEATIACARFRLPPDNAQWNIPVDLVPIGVPFPGMGMTVCGENLVPVADGTPGELLLNGRQVARGYLAAPDKTAHSFVTLPGRNEVFYRTGDRAVRGRGGNTHFLGRVDNQVKIRGYRVELGAIESVVRGANADACNVVAMSWPPGAASGTSVVIACESEAIDVQAIMDASRQNLPEYMVPSRIVCLPTFPTNSSGKADRRAIAAAVQEIFRHEHDHQALAGLPAHAMQLMQSILRISPNLNANQIRQADTLMAGGMDSLSFIGLTAEIERMFGVTLEQDDVVALAEMSFDKMVDTVTAYRPGNATARPSESKNNSIASPSQSAIRANRAINFIERFPDVLREQDVPLVLAVGSSGIFRSFAPDVFDAAAHEAGMKIRSFNIGIPVISCVGMTHICEFIRDCCTKSGVRPPLIIYELDPMHISTLPPKGEIDLGPEYFSGQIKSYTDDSLVPELRWKIKSRGAGDFNIEMGRQRIRAKWEREREYEIARTFLGDVAFDKDAVASWLEGAKALSTITDRLVGFIHPADQSMIDAAADRWSADRFSTVLREIKEKSSIPIIDWTDFSLNELDFMDINHVNPWSGMQKLTLQLARKCFSLASENFPD